MVAAARVVGSAAAAVVDTMDVLNDILDIFYYHFLIFFGRHPGEGGVNKRHTRRTAAP